MVHRNIFIEKSCRKHIEQQDVEMVERKALGHPDTICDGCCDAASIALSTYYLKNFGHVLHHNLDKGLIFAGKSNPRFRGGRISEPIRLIIAGRATDEVQGKKIPVKEICIRAAKEWMNKNLNVPQNLSPFSIDIYYQPGSADLQEVFTRKKGGPIANDTSFGVAHAPLSRTEKIVQETADLLNSKEMIDKFPAIGSDVKVMGLRKKDKIKLTVAIAFVDKFIGSLKEYFGLKEKIKEELKEKINFNNNVEIDINALDDQEARSENEIYITCSGLSAEQGDDGQVGRGNRVHGLITPCRGMSLEAAAGKNINHPGKLYQILAQIIAQQVSRIDNVKECYVQLLSEIGKPLDEPQVAAVDIVSNCGEKEFESIREKVEDITNNVLDNLQAIQKDIAFGKYLVY